MLHIFILSPSQVILEIFSAELVSPHTSRLSSFNLMLKCFSHLSPQGPQVQMSKLSSSDRWEWRRNQTHFCTCLHSFPLWLCGNWGAASHDDRQVGPGVTSVSFSQDGSGGPHLAGGMWLLLWSTYSNVKQIRVPRKPFIQSNITVWNSVTILLENSISSLLTL